jgi:large subunit ribosomal protein L24
MRKFHIKKGDLVQVNAGEDRKKQGKVLEVDPKKERAIVEGINMVSKHMKPNSAHPQGGIVKKEASIHISNLNVVDPTTGKPTRVGRKRVEVEISKDGKTVTKTKSVRYAKKSGTELK